MGGMGGRGGFSPPTEACRTGPSRAADDMDAVERNEPCRRGTDGFVARENESARCRAAGEPGGGGPAAGEPGGGGTGGACL